MILSLMDHVNKSGSISTPSSSRATSCLLYSASLRVSIASNRAQRTTTTTRNYEHEMKNEVPIVCPQEVHSYLWDAGEECRLQHWVKRRAEMRRMLSQECSCGECAQHPYA